MKIDMLGTAQDGGCPHAGCYCENCLAVYEEKESEKYPVSLGITSNCFKLLVYKGYMEVISIYIQFL